MSQRRPAPPPYGTLVFDCDSTLSSIEGVESLAAGREAEIRELTERAMAGDLPLEAVYGERLDRIRPSRSQVAEVGQRYVQTLLPHARELVAALHFLEKRVCIVSGGLLPAVLTVAEVLGVPPEEVEAVSLVHDSQGAYLGFDEASPLTRAGGKRTVVAGLAEGQDARPPVALVGDGVTDLEAAPICARFVAFGGVVRREAVFAAADATCEAPDLAALLPLLTDEAELARLADHPRHRGLVEAARAHGR